jgi:predicted RNA-binding Zn-ribbon protein involved in translation (DUF1610 family)
MRKILEKIYVSDDGRATITCPNCGLTRQARVDQYRGRKHTIKINCSCGNSFPVHLEFRRVYRKQTDLKGTYRILSSGGGGGQVAIRDLSRNGIGFTVSGIHSIKIGQRALIDFTLDNRKRSRLQKEVIIRSIDSNLIGCEFNNQQAFEKDLGFYLQP